MPGDQKNLDHGGMGALATSPVNLGHGIGEQLLKSASLRPRQDKRRLAGWYSHRARQQSSENLLHVQHYQNAPIA